MIILLTFRIDKNIENKKGDTKMKGECKAHEKKMKHVHGMSVVEDLESEYTYVKEVELHFEEVIERVKEELKKESFGVLSEICVDKLFKEKIGLEIEPYIILGVCNPNYSSQLISIDVNSGAFLPCNILVYVKDKKTYVSAMLPTKAMKITGNEELLKVSEQVERILKNVVDKV